VKRYAPVLALLLVAGGCGLFNVISGTVGEQTAVNLVLSVFFVLAHCVLLAMCVKFDSMAGIITATVYWSVMFAVSLLYTVNAELFPYFGMLGFVTWKAAQITTVLTVFAIYPFFGFSVIGVLNTHLVALACAGLFLIMTLGCFARMHGARWRGVIISSVPYAVTGIAMTANLTAFAPLYGADMLYIYEEAPEYFAAAATVAPPLWLSLGISLVFIALMAYSFFTGLFRHVPAVLSFLTGYGILCILTAVLCFFDNMYIFGICAGAYACVPAVLILSPLAGIMTLLGGMQNAGLIAAILFGAVCFIAGVTGLRLEKKKRQGYVMGNY